MAVREEQVDPGVRQAVEAQPVGDDQSTAAAAAAPAIVVQAGAPRAGALPVVVETDQRV